MLAGKGAQAVIGVNLFPPATDEPQIDLPAARTADPWFTLGRLLRPLRGVLALGLVFVQGYLGGRMTYEHGVGVYDGGQMARTAIGVSKLDVALARGVDQVTAGRMAFSARAWLTRNGFQSDW